MTDHVSKSMSGLFMYIKRNVIFPVWMKRNIFGFSELYHKDCLDFRFCIKWDFFLRSGSSCLLILYQIVGVFACVLNSMSRCHQRHGISSTQSCLLSSGRSINHTSGITARCGPRLDSGPVLRSGMSTPLKVSSAQYRRSSARQEGTAVTMYC